MHTSVFARSAVAVASLAIGSVVLGVAPATAATSSGITREEVLSVAASDDFGNRYGPATQSFVEKVCGFDDETGRDIEFNRATPVDGDSGVDGFLIQAYVEGDDQTPSRSCTFAAFAVTEPASTMSGTVNITLEDQIDSTELRAADATPNHDYPLSGDVYVTAPVDDIGYGDPAVASASGDVLKTEAATTTSSRVVTPKSTRVKAAALKTYHRTIDKAKTKLSKSLKKAGDSSSKRAAARKTYAASKKAAKAKLHIAWLGDKKTVVTTEATKVSRTPFTLTTQPLGCNVIARC